MFSLSAAPAPIVDVKVGKEHIHEFEFVKKHEAPRHREQWHLIDAVWLSAWMNYARDAGPHPGPINNRNLLDPNTNYSRVKAMLIPKTHYLGTSPTAWKFLHGLYGGGPCFPSAAMDIYSAKIEWCSMAPGGPLPQAAPQALPKKRPQPQPLKQVDDGEEVSPFDSGRSLGMSAASTAASDRSFSLGRGTSKKTPTPTSSRSLSSSFLQPLKSLLPHRMGSSKSKGLGGDSSTSPGACSSTSSEVSEATRSRRYNEFAAKRGFKHQPGELSVRGAGKPTGGW